MREWAFINRVITLALLVDGDECQLHTLAALTVVLLDRRMVGNHRRPLCHGELFMHLPGIIH
jgi:hypothetical protein